ncbi:hypothetical protein M409DRAFT_18221 [Zasmidium cellare ATCC 36951]|uniref:Uncharacterized protein n=1 Tax=Zasmidium cellare ATCC 36951 TaxID=1080233 RepID=A0A6A6D0L2_ZASCE|nr:uncharacterized protein M409DRAFT_18221 [Zasmidium cellare ATCC 36951]KAF2171990.1 hypothetical protein M409DRAFT_18221 [Zasmidium cellare ATCC 36951]
MYSGMNGSIMPSAGHYSDMQTLMQNMESLSGWLEQNRQEWAQVQEGIARVERIQGRLAQQGQLPLLNGDTQPVEEPAQPTISQLQTALATANNRLASFERTYQEQIRLQQLYEDTLSDTTDRIRQYCFEQQNHIIAVHQHYTQLLSQARSETIEAQLTHQAWQSSLQRLSEGVRSALKSREEEGLPYKRRIAALKEENRILRAKVGWDPPAESEDEEEGAGAGLDEGRGRVSQGGMHGQE